MINFKRITKTANANGHKILEFNDFMQINNFDENKGGNLSSTLHSKFSKIGVIIVDTTGGKKEKAKVLKFNFEPSTIKAIAQKIVDGSKDLFIPGYMLEKIDPYNADNNGYSQVSKITIRYQEQMNNPWTFIIENGIGVPVKNATTGGINIKKGSYKKSCFSQVVMDNWTAIIKMCEIKNYIDKWENVNMSSFIKLRNAAEKKYIANIRNNKPDNKNDNNSSINANTPQVSNTNLSSNSKQDSNNTELASKTELENSSTSDKPNLICSYCKSKINQKIYDYSIKKHGTPLCMDCQKNASSNDNTKPAASNSQKQDNIFCCTDCKNKISQKVYNYSTEKYGMPLCMNCQGKHRHQSKSA